MPNNLITGLENKRFGRLTALYLCDVPINRKRLWKCRCDCGAEVFLPSTKLISGHTRSCGCLKRDTTAERSRESNATHHRSNTKVYDAYRGMKKRCYNPNTESYPRYGGRGVTVCERWRESFENFFADMGDPSPGLSLDRIERDGHYSCGKCPECILKGWPLNCQWADDVQQNRNRSFSHFYTIDGFNGTISALAEHFAVPRGVIKGMIARGETSFSQRRPHKTDKFKTISASTVLTT